MNKKIKLLFITTSSLSTNPRLVKELCLVANKAKVEVIAFNIGGWTVNGYKTIIKNLIGVNVQLISATRNPFIPWLFSTLVQQAFIIISKFFKKSLIINSLAHNKRTALILFYLLLKNKKYKSDLIVCHTLGALFPGYLLTKKTGAKLAFDMEDYHPLELIEKISEAEKRRREEILKRILPKCEYISFATDGLFELTKKFITENIKNPIIVYNSFPSDEFIEPNQNDVDKIKFIWFSQTIGRGRGLELFFEAIKEVDFNYEITLIGNFNEKEFEKEIKRNNNLIIIDPMPQKELHKKLSEFDIGLSLELNSTDLNRDYAMTNKLFAYLQAGLFVLATDTPAQKEFMEHNSGFGILCGQSPEVMVNVLNLIKENIDGIRKDKIRRFNEAKKFSWENESKKLITIWEKILT
jgi:glycosyltransferase involved in cell wall biosynthesis